jgi:outer membrane immunogenic protein
MRTLLAVSALVLTGSAAFAADPIYSPTPAYDWSGLWIGADLGYVSGSVTGNTTNVATSGPSGLDAGVHATYNFISGNWVHGPFISIPFGGASGTVTGLGTTKVDWAVAAGYSVGYAMDRWLPYVFAGGVVGGGSVNFGSAPTSNTHLGYTLGAGVSYAVTDRWSAGLRYAFMSAEKKSYGVVPGMPFGWDAHSIAATINFKLY